MSQLRPGMTALDRAENAITYAIKQGHDKVTLDPQEAKAIYNLASAAWMLRSFLRLAFAFFGRDIAFRRQYNTAVIEMERTKQ